MTARWRAVDALRGIVIALMVLDHLRDFLGNAHFDATDLAVTTTPIFLSRWITHFCAPTFFLLAGASARLSIASGRRTVAAAARFLVTRGLALVLVEQTVLRCFGWYFHFDYHFMNAGVLYGLGLCMAMLAALVWLPPAVSLALGAAIILGEPLLARIELGWAGDLLLRSRDFEPVSGYHFFVSYPPLPWLGAMALGYGMSRNPRWLAATGLAMLAAFVALRALAHPDSVLGFLNVDKYPPTTTFLLVTLGVALLALAALDRHPIAVFEVYGRVPLFLYLVHIPLIHALAVVYSYATFGDASWLTSGPVIFWDTPLPGSPPDYGLSLPLIYAVWIALLGALYPTARTYWTRTRSRAADRPRGSSAPPHRPAAPPAPP